VKKDLDSGRIRSQLLEDMGRGIDMGDWRELRSFIAWSQQRFPADHYALVIWNHGAGWRNTRSVSIDDATGNEIQTWQLPQALNVSPRLDMVIFDASLMQMLEVAYEIRNSTDVVVGSEESPPGEGYVYDGFLGDLAANPTMTAPQFGAKIVTRTLAAYGTGSNITQSALDTSKLQTVADKLSLFANSLSAHSSSQRAVLVAAREQAEHYLYSENKDLWHYAELVRANSNSAPLRNAATAVQQAIGDALIAEGHGSQHADSHGIAVYLPSPASYLTTYANLALSRVTDWDLWLQSQPP
jgi:hypothetical protein